MLCFKTYTFDYSIIATPVGLLGVAEFKRSKLLSDIAYQFGKPACTNSGTIYQTILEGHRL